MRATAGHARLQLLVLFAALALAAPLAATAAWEALGPEGGMAWDLVMDPRGPGVLYAATNAGVHKTADGGGSWRLANQGIIGPVWDLAIDPGAAASVYAAGRGVFRSDDGGASWRRVDAGLPRIFGRPIVHLVESAAPGMVYAVVQQWIDSQAVYVSRDGGSSWVQATAGAPRRIHFDLVADPRHPQMVVLATDRGIYRSDDAGGHWAPASRGPAIADVRTLTADPDTPGVFWAGTAFDFHRPKLARIYRSTDGGRTWKARARGLAGGSEVLSLAVDPASSDVVYAGVFHGERPVYRTGNGGRSWQPAAKGLPAFIDVRALIVDPRSPRRVWAGAGGGFDSRPTVFASTSSGNRWAPAGAGIRAANVTAMATRPGVTGVLYAGTFDRGLLRSPDGGRSWTESPLTGAQRTVIALAADPADGDVLYLATWGGLLRSDDRGATMVEVTPAGHEPAAFTSLAVTATGTVLAAHRDGLFATTDRGTSWRIVKQGDVFRVAASVGEPVAYAILQRPSPPHHALLRSDDAGVTWTETGLQVNFAATLAVDAADARRLWLPRVPVEGRLVLLRSDDGGATATDLSGGAAPFRVEAVAADPHVADRLWAATVEGGVLVSRDGGLTWTDASAGLRVGRVTGFAFDAEPGVVYAFSYGGGVLRWRDGG
jgi:photosystem II stability/assembly factor-like uncharacterized protein